MIRRLLLVFAIVGVVAVVIVGMGFLPVRDVAPFPGAVEGESYLLVSNIQLTDGGRVVPGLGDSYEITIPAGTGTAVIRLELSNAGLGDAVDVRFAVTVGSRDIMWCTVGMFGMCNGLTDASFSLAEGWRQTMELHIPMLFAGTLTFWPFTIQLVDAGGVQQGPNTILMNRGL